jgi:hypothetical protein
MSKTTLRWARLLIYAQCALAALSVLVGTSEHYCWGQSAVPLMRARFAIVEISMVAFAFALGVACLCIRTNNKTILWILISMALWFLTCAGLLPPVS